MKTRTVLFSLAGVALLCAGLLAAAPDAVSAVPGALQLLAWDGASASGLALAGLGQIAITGAAGRTGLPAILARPAIGRIRNDPPPANREVAELADKLTKAFEDYKKVNNDRLDEIAKIGNETPEMKAQLAKADADIDEIKAALDKASKDIARLTAGGRSDADVDPKAVRDAAEVFLAGKGNRERDEVSDDAVAEYQLYRDSFSAMLRKGEKHRALQKPEIQNAMQVGSDPDGGYWVPTEMATRILQRIFETSPMRQLASVLSITGDSVKFPTDTNDATSGGWVGETETRSETATPQVGEQEIFAREQYAMPKVTQKLLDMSALDVEGWLGRKIADKMARTENTAFVSGTGVKAPKGFLTYKSAAVTTADASRDWGVLQYVASGASAGFPKVSGSTADDPGALIDLIAALKPEYRANANWVCNRAAEAAIRKLRDADGRYLVGMGDIREGVRGFLLHDYPIVTAEDMPDLASDSFSLAFGDFREGYQIVDGRGIRVLRDNLTQKGWVLFYTTKWTGGDVVNFDAIKLMKFAA